MTYHIKAVDDKKGRVLYGMYNDQYVLLKSNTEPFDMEIDAEVELPKVMPDLPSDLRVLVGPEVLDP